MADTKSVSNAASTKRKKRPLGRDLEEDLCLGEPPPKRFKEETDCVKADTSGQESGSQAGLKKLDCIYNTPTKNEVDFRSPTSIKSLSELQSPADSAYNSSGTPWNLQACYSVSASSGFDSDTFDAGLSPEKQTSDTLFKFFHQNYTTLKDELSPKPLADQLLNLGIISTNSAEEVREPNLPRAKACDILIKAICQSRHIRDPRTEQKIKDAFSAVKSSYLLDNLGKDCKNTVNIGCKFGKMEIMAKLRVLMTELEDRVEPRHVIDDLVTMEMLTLLEHDDIYKTDFKSKRMTLLMNYLLKDLEQNFPKFCVAVEKQLPDLGCDSKFMEW